MVGKRSGEFDAPPIETLRRRAIVSSLVLCNGLVEGLALPIKLTLPLVLRALDEIVDRVPALGAD
jgi:hypothetical protein